MRGISLGELKAADDVAALLWLVQALPSDSAIARARGDIPRLERLLMDFWAALWGEAHPSDPWAPPSAVQKPALPNRLVEQRERRNRMGGKPLDLEQRGDPDG